MLYFFNLRAMGIEPILKIWKIPGLPLTYARTLH